ncbi:MAG: DsbA family protein [Caulobacteraceae bacterium]
MRRLAPLLAGVAVVLAMAGCQRASAGDAAFDSRVHAYLLAHPEVIQQAQERLQAKLVADEAGEQRRALADLPRLRAAVERDPRDFVANPAGKITVTEFYDYRCPHCANAAPRVLALIRANPDVRFVFKEMPIFGPTSEHAARAAMSVKAAGGDYLGYYARVMGTPALDDDAIDKAERRAGGRPQNVAETGRANRQIADTTSLFTKLALGGTPAFVIGDQIVYGEDMDAVDAAIARARGSASRT